MSRALEFVVTTSASPASVWRALTTPTLMTRWMGEPEMDVGVETTWAVGSPICISGFHHVRFESSGVVLAFEPQARLTYTHLNSVSRLPPTPENHSTLEFTLSPSGDGTRLRLRITGFPSESIFKHLEFYWRGTLTLLGRFCEQLTP